MVVLWILVLLSITVGIYAILARTEGLQARFLLDETAARYAAEAGVHRAVFEMRSTDMETRWVPDGRPYTIELGEAEIEIRITDESGKINLNAADAELLTDFFISRGVEELEALHLADAILDWRDPDDMPRLYGAEIDDYFAAGYPYGPANEDFVSVDELQQVIGMTWDLYREVEPFLTVHSGRGRINPAFASAEVLAAMPEIDLESARLFVEERRQFHPADQQALMLPDGQMVNLQGGGRTFSIRSRATLDNGIWSEIDTTVTLGTDTRGRPFRIQRWRDRNESQ
ncbi:general secretion pathway protein GspK [Wenzhouxiangella sp. AB-CW3]|uniref:general secretion pathway protein GspK n=1 Tax=Wenzhouxiangella sp. AB-CW3 TaxID=2771012 RepID=UPI001CC2725E|nr:type II secretion system protein GspK [Wenzhouxiangella sp. AB-CW3]